MKQRAAFANYESKEVCDFAVQIVAELKERYADVCRTSS